MMLGLYHCVTDMDGVVRSANSTAEVPCIPLVPITSWKPLCRWVPLLFMYIVLVYNCPPVFHLLHKYSMQMSLAEEGNANTN